MNGNLGTSDSGGPRRLRWTRISCTSGTPRCHSAAAGSGGCARGSRVLPPSRRAIRSLGKCLSCRSGWGRACTRADRSVRPSDIVIRCVARSAESVTAATFLPGGASLLSTPFDGEGLGRAKVAMALFAVVAGNPAALLPGGAARHPCYEVRPPGPGRPRHAPRTFARRPCARVPVGAAWSGVGGDAALDLVRHRKRPAAGVQRHLLGSGFITNR